MTRVRVAITLPTADVPKIHALRNGGDIVNFSAFVHEELNRRYGEYMERVTLQIAYDSSRAKGGPK